MSDEPVLDSATEAVLRSIAASTAERGQEIAIDVIAGRVHEFDANVPIADIRLNPTCGIGIELSRLVNAGFIRRRTNTPHGQHVTLNPAEDTFILMDPGRQWLDSRLPSS